MGQSLNYPKPQFPHLLNGEANLPYPKALLQGLTM